MIDAYEIPAYGWTCFHCGENFRTVGAARDHFGFDPTYDPACRIKLGAERGLVMALRKAEAAAAEAWAKLHNENSDLAIAFQKMTSRHAEQLVAAEELGYERGLRDSIRQNLELKKLAAADEQKDAAIEKQRGGT